MKKLEALNQVLMTFFETFRYPCVLAIFAILHYLEHMPPASIAVLMVFATSMTYLHNLVLLARKKGIQLRDVAIQIIRHYSHESHWKINPPSHRQTSLVHHYQRTAGRMTLQFA